MLNFWATVCKTVRPMLSHRCLSCLSVLSVCDIGALWPNGLMDQDETWHGGRPRPQPHCIKWGPTSPSPRGAQPPIFGPCLLWPNGWLDEDTTWYESRPRPMPHVFIDGVPALRKRGTAGPTLCLCHSRPSQLLLGSCLYVFKEAQKYQNQLKNLLLEFFGGYVVVFVSIYMSLLRFCEKFFSTVGCFIFHWIWQIQLWVLYKDRIANHINGPGRVIGPVCLCLDSRY